MSSYVVERRTTVDAPADRIHGLVADFHEWPAWSPWEDLDPDLRREYSGAARGVGARYAWSGNRKAGRGTMEIVGDDPDRVEVRVAFEKPFRSTSTSTFRFTTAAGGTEVVWSLAGEQSGLAALLGRLVPMDRLLGGDLEQGLTRLRTAAATP
ncbi:SRPBCC family protein [Pseudonocardia alni]|uniref:SRPBCC family protein n=1 Tax=Pseudonocardia alni TaxID=33907 RepID=UPI00279FA968|nr:SRPBCC family protein [Pseudonocardia alni]